MPKANDTLTEPRTHRQGPLVAAILASAAATLFTGITALLAEAIGCDFAGGRCDGASTSGLSPVLVAVVAAGVAWGSVAWVARARGGLSARWLQYLLAIGVPLVAAIVGFSAIVAAE
jgi:hypothetical protein